MANKEIEPEKEKANQATESKVKAKSAPAKKSSAKKSAEKNASKPKTDEAKSAPAKKPSAEKNASKPEPKADETKSTPAKKPSAKKTASKPKPNLKPQEDEFKITEGEDDLVIEDKVAEVADNASITTDAESSTEGKETESAETQSDDFGDADSFTRRPKSDELHDKIVFVNRCSKVVKGGRRFSFSALIVAGNQDGWVGYGFGKANEATEAIVKATGYAKKNIFYIKRFKTTIPHEVLGKFGGGRVLLKPASEGTGVIAGGGVRAVMEMSGIKNVLAKSLGSQNHANVVKATLDALKKLRTKEEILALRA